MRWLMLLVVTGCGLGIETPKSYQGEGAAGFGIGTCPPPDGGQQAYLQDGECVTLLLDGGAP